MRITLTTLLVLVTCVAVTPAQDHRAAMGVWVLNLEQSRFEPGPLPRRQTSTFTQMGDGSIKIENDSIDAQGRASHREMISKFDGRPEARAGSAQPTTRAYRWLDDRNFEFEETINGQRSVIGRTSVSKDGRVRTLKVDGTRGGRPVHNIEVYELERGAPGH
jgi:hypothetical protein